MEKDFEKAVLSALCEAEELRKEEFDSYASEHAMNIFVKRSGSKLSEEELEILDKREKHLKEDIDFLAECEKQLKGMLEHLIFHEEEKRE